MMTLSVIDAAQLEHRVAAGFPSRWDLIIQGLRSAIGATHGFRVVRVEIAALLRMARVRDAATVSFMAFRRRADWQGNGECNENGEADNHRVVLMGIRGFNRPRPANLTGSTPNKR